ncbi:glutathione S-transferase family protein [Pseudoalteromonas sp. CR1]|jgi:glutathione S-transferase|uniref:glutathione S-transferase family protein n=1 Tax=unclassified Pseudoalteromonas TaxID=194690 RepID=UPI00073182AD|nr:MULTISPECIES: glutathione S-transferase family protein [unclassified Pseudoalteromonas]KTD98771.1 glutathione S-transferase [Pseudoalteromonas sp. H71]MBW4965258.1 glutathione S-transferase family protein [Pseudoalteromonas sp. CR1]|tara:strand:- start:2162 stop:2815 length:654 start_codon:yes stop_codon:yes gene_type:complete
MELFIGNKNYSSWSLRAWYLMSKFELEFDESQLVLDTPHFYSELKKHFTVLKVPALIDGDLQVWDSLAICEYINDAYLSQAAWPKYVTQRATARALSAEMHSGFIALRREMPMNIRAKRKIILSDDAIKDIARIDDIFSKQQVIYPNQWMFGDFSIVDAMYAPIVLRLKTYQITLSKAANSYCQHVLACPVLQSWITQALQETDIVDADEAGVDLKI